MKKITLLLAMAIIATACKAKAINTWNAYPAYSDITEIEPAGNLVYVLASEGLYSYNKNDNSLQTYDKTTVLNDCSIARIAYCKAAKRLLILYKNYNIDLLDSKGNVTNIPDYYNKSMTEDKTVNSIFVDGNYAYLTTSFGILKINVKNAEISDTYNLGYKVNNMVVSNGYMYLVTPTGTMKGNVTKNLLDKNNWNRINGNGFDAIFNIGGKLICINNVAAYRLDENNGSTTELLSIFNRKAIFSNGKIICFGGESTAIVNSITDFKTINTKFTAIAYDPSAQCFWQKNAENKLQSFTIDGNNQINIQSSGVKPEGPLYNYFGFLKFANGMLYSCSGGYGKGGENLRNGCIQALKDRNWVIYQDNLAQIVGHRYEDNISLDIDPSDINHVFMGGKTGLYEFQNGTLIKHYNIDNSPLQSALGDNKDYVVVETVKFDKNGNLWLLNSMAPSNSLMEYNPKDGKWTSHQNVALVNNSGQSLAGLQNLFFDSRGLLWFVNNHWVTPSLYFFQTDKDTLNSFKSFVNQDGTTLSLERVRCVTEDINGNIWIGTDIGPLMLEPSQIYKGAGAIFTQVKIPRNDGTNFADYLLSGVDITCIAVDGAGRKWFGTNGNGAYLISEDNMTQVHHFLATNSRLLSNNIEDIAIDHATGEVFFGTDKGLCSYISDATAPSDEMTKDNVYAYPNPVRPDYNGPITVVGLSLNADVKIVTVNGVLVKQGRSNGGTFVWDGKDRYGNRVASGVYMVETATADGNKGTVCKIAVVR